MSLDIKSFELMGLPALFHDSSWKFCLDHGLSQHVERYLSRVELAFAGGIGMFIGGVPSSGKSYLASIVAKVYRKHGRSVQWIDSVVGYELLAWNKEHHDQEYGTWPIRCEMVDVLIIDNLGSEKTGKRSKIMLELLRKRIEAKRPTIVTTRFTLAQLAELYGEDLTFVKDSMRHVVLPTKIESTRQQEIKEQF